MKSASAIPVSYGDLHCRQNLQVDWIMDKARLGSSKQPMLNWVFKVRPRALFALFTLITQDPNSAISWSRGALQRRN